MSRQIEHIADAATLRAIKRLDGEIDALVNPRVQTYSAKWTGDTTNPDLGNGTLAAYYLLLGHLCLAWGKLTAGSTTVFGTGQYRITVPKLIVNPALIIGQGVLTDASSATYPRAVTLLPAQTARDSFYIVTAANTFWTESNPFTMVATDSFYWTILFPWVAA